MRKLFALLLLLLAISLGSNAQTKEMLGLKGKILSHEVKFFGTDAVSEDWAKLSYKEENGILKSFNILDIQFSNISVHANSVSGSYYIPDLKKKGRFIGGLNEDNMLESISINPQSESMDVEFKYNSHDQLDEITVYASDGFYTMEVTMDFYDYRFDTFGNWTYRKVRMTNDNTDDVISYYQTQTITYPRNYAEQLMWEQAEKDGSMEAFASLAENTDVAEYQQRAVNRWNEMAMQKLQTNDATKKDLLQMMSQKVASPQVKAECERMFSARYVTPENDYVQLRALLNNDLLTSDLRESITRKADEAYTDSVNHLTDRMENAYSSKQFAECIEYAQQLDNIKPGTNRTMELMAESAYNLLAEKEKSGNIDESDYELFMRRHATSSHFEEVADKRARLVLARAKATSSAEEYQRLKSLPMSDALRQKLLPEADKQIGKIGNKAAREQKMRNFRNNRGNFFHMQFGGGVDLGSYGPNGYGEVNMRLGWHRSVINLLVGAKYNFITNWDNPWNSDSKKSEYLIARKISIPVLLRFNVKRRYKSSTYVGIGAEYNIPAGDVTVDGEKLPSKDFLNSESKISPRLSLGWSGRAAEFEFYVLYNMKPEFNNLGEHFNAKMWSDDATNKLRGGMKFTFGF